MAPIYATGLCATDNVCLMEKATEFFATRLVKKGSRRDNPFEEGSCLLKCIEEFRALVRHLVDASAAGTSVECAWWENACEALSFKYVGVSHWICPVRMAEYLLEQGLCVAWSGEMCEKKRVPPSDFLKKKVRRERNPAQPAAFHCKYCNVTCNSAAQMLVHNSGSRHTLVVAQLTKKHGAATPDVLPSKRERRRRGCISTSGDERSSTGCSSEAASACVRTPKSAEDGESELYSTMELENLLQSVVASLEMSA
eukprot:TRINITY_DN3631_c0_g2_i1.p1 TRINITY_DN3631_c0_g2~~TRINITY_DN3631_c0_g2_i1.p1  ORF type:complete len:254 (+),score=56.76 TRINITY_DN3631_c0_g2_i1:57-818(+)